MPSVRTEQIPTARRSSSLDKSSIPPPGPAVVRGTFTRNVPAEVLIRIIELATDNTFCGLPIIASHVCSHWRELTLSTPLLWTETYIHNVRTDITHKLERAHASAARSGGCAMAVRIDLSPPRVLDARRLVSPIIEYVSQHAGRIQHLTVRYTPEFGSAEVSALVPVPARQLETCVIDNVPSDFFGDYAFKGYSNQLQTISAFQRPEDSSSQAGQMFPNLGELSLSATSLTWSRFAPRRLRCLSLQNLTSDIAPRWGDLWDILEANRLTLVDVDLGWVRPVSPSVHPSVHKPLGLPMVEKLRIQYAGPSFLLNFFAAFRVPHIRALHLHDEGEDDDDQARNSIQWSAYVQIIDHVPLERLHYLHLSDVSFLPSSRETVELGADPLPAALFRRLCALERLKISWPDCRTLEALDTPLGVGVDNPRRARLSLRQADPEVLENFLVGRGAMAVEERAPMFELDVQDIHFHPQAQKKLEFPFVELTRGVVNALGSPLA